MGCVLRDRLLHFSLSTSQLSFFLPLSSFLARCRISLIFFDCSIDGIDLHRLLHDHLTFNRIDFLSSFLPSTTPIDFSKMSDHARIITVYLAPPFYITAFFLMLFAFLGPVPVGHTKTSLAFVYPAIPMTQANVKREWFLDSTNVAAIGDELRKFPRAVLAERAEVLAATPKVDGPTIRLGIFGSCARKNNNANDICTKPSFDTTYDFSALPSSAPTLTLGPPPMSASIFLVVLCFTFVFLLLHIITLLPHQMWFKLPAPVAKVSTFPILSVVTPYIGLFAFSFGLLMVGMWQAQFSKEVRLFNAKIATMGSKAPQLQASLGNGFTMLWIAYAFSVPSIICAFFKRSAKTI
jgi:hypothetical protein